MMSSTHVGSRRNAHVPASSLKAFIGLMIMAMSSPALAGSGRADIPDCRITVVFNNIRAADRLQTAWGFSCVVTGYGHTLLFDTGSDGRILLDNMRQLNIDPTVIDVVVLSHSHGDHAGGLELFLLQNPLVTVYLPRSFPSSFQQQIRLRGAEVVAINGPVQLFDRIHSTGEVGSGIKEQSLILETSKGLVIITGCAHPGMVDIVRKARQYLGKEVYLIMGGFHLMGASSKAIDEQLEQLKALRVEKVAPSHCTGEAAIARFRQEWGDDFLAGGCGAVVEISP